MTDTTEITMTVAEMRDVDARIDAICALADRLWALDPDEQSHPYHWALLKPIVLDVVGWERDVAIVNLPLEPSDPNEDPAAAHAKFMESVLNPDPSLAGPEPVTDVDRFLRSETAWRRIMNYVTRQNEV